MHMCIVAFVRIDFSVCCFCNDPVVPFVSTFSGGSQFGGGSGKGSVVHAWELQWVMWCVITFLWGCFGSRRILLLFDVRCLHSVHVTLHCFVCRPRMSHVCMYVCM